MASVGERHEAIVAMRGRLWLPGRPSKARCEDRVRFWEAIGRGLSSEDAAGEAGVSPAVGFRWFRQAGGMPSLSLGAVSGRYLLFAEREEIAIFMLRVWGCVRSAAGWVVQLRRSRGSCAGTRRLVIGMWFIGQRLRSGTRTGVLVARRSPSRLPMTSFATMCRIALVG